MKKAIVTTTINQPTHAIKKYIKIAEAQDWHFFIVGDKRTPHGQYKKLESDHVTYLHPDDQVAISEELSDLIGWNCIQRRNFGLIAAHQWGAEIIATIDDDNIPYDFWGKSVELYLGKPRLINHYKVKEPVFDPISPFLGNIWHRGFPVQMLNERKLPHPVTKEITPLVQADFWDGDPDVDAICRIALAPEVKFPDSVMKFTSNALMPFNSQNTFMHRSIFPTYFLFPHVGRMDDIWAAYMVGAEFPESVMFSRASVIQKRNDHDLVKDLDAEMLGYVHNQAIVKNPELILSLLPMDAMRAYQVYKGILS